LVAFVPYNSINSLFRRLPLCSPIVITFAIHTSYNKYTLHWIAFSTRSTKVCLLIIKCLQLGYMEEIFKMNSHDFVFHDHLNDHRIYSHHF
jgi:hypothetical protein